MKRLGHVLVVVLLAGMAHRLSAKEPDLRTAEIRALRQEYAAERAAIAGKRLDGLRVLLKHHLEEQQRRQRQAKLSGNTTQHADAAQAVLLFEKALETLEREGTFAFPAKVRPALERMVALCTRTLASEDAARDAGFKLLDTRFAGRLQPLLVRQGITADPAQLAAHWQAVLQEPGAAAPADGAPAGEPETPAEAAGAAPAPAVAADGGATNEAVLGIRGTAAAWVPLARIGVEVGAIEVIALPVAGATGRVERQGTGIESGAPWQAAVNPYRAFTPPADGVAPAMRVRAVPGRHPLDVVEWPSRRNGWTIELRLRPPVAGRSRHGCVLEIDAAAAGG